MAKSADTPECRCNLFLFSTIRYVFRCVLGIMTGFLADKVNSEMLKQVDVRCCQKSGKECAIYNSFWRASIP